MRHLSIKTRLYLLTAISAVGLLIVLAVSIWCLMTFRVNGPVYRQIVQSKDIVADILPPPMYVIEAYLNVNQASDTDDLEQIKKLQAHVAKLQQDFEDRYRHWSAQLTDDPELRSALLERSGAGAREFFRIALEEYFPARLRGDKAASDLIMHGKLRDAYEAHRQQIDQTVEIARRRTAQTETETAARVNFWSRALLVISVAAAVGVTVLCWSLARSVLRSTSILIERVEQMAGSDADLAARVNIDSRDEMGRLADGINQVLTKVQVVVQRMQAAEERMIESEKMRSVGGLAAGMAHEINNPLAGMLQNAQVILKRFEPDLPANSQAAANAGTTIQAIQAYMKQRGVIEMLQDIRVSGERAADIVAKMLAFSRDADAQPSYHSLAGLLDQAVELAHSDYELKKLFDSGRIDLIREYEADLPPVTCRSSEIQQVVLNLLTNAADALQRGQSTIDRPTIVLRTRRPNRATGDSSVESAVFEVQDNGPGIPESIRSRIFEPFFTTREPQQGTGMGLFVSYFIITRNHGGTISVESANGLGTRVIVTLPLKAKS